MSSTDLRLNTFMIEYEATARANRLGLEKKFKEIDDTFERIHEDYNRLKEDLKDVQESLTGIRRRLDSAHERITSLESNNTSLRASLHDVRECLFTSDMHNLNSFAKLITIVTENRRICNVRAKRKKKRGGKKAG